MTFEKHHSSVSRAAFQRLGILRKSWQVFHDLSLLVRSFRCFFLPCLKYFSPVWCSAADAHPKLLDPVVSGASFLSGGVLEFNLPLSIHCSFVSAVYDQDWLYTTTFWCTACPFCVSAYGLQVVPFSLIGILRHVRWGGTGGFEVQSKCLFVSLSCSLLFFVFNSSSLL